MTAALQQKTNPNPTKSSTNLQIPSYNEKLRKNMKVVMSLSK